MLPIHLANIKSSGVYRFTFDKSLVIDQSVETLRLVVGYSEKGPFNTVMYIRDNGTFEEVYGKSTKKLERRGIYFHRLANQCLAKGPILCLNLKKFENEVVSGYTFNPEDINEVSEELTKQFEASIEDIFDTTRFWQLSPEKLEKEDTLRQFAEDGVPGNPIVNKYITLTSTGDSKSSISVLMKPADAHNYDVTIADWYVQYGEEMPEYLEGYENMMVSDFFVDLYAFTADLTKPSLALEKYFDVIKTGVDEDTADIQYRLKTQYNGYDTLYLLSNDLNSGFISKYTGSLLPYFRDLDASDLSIDLLFNKDNTIHQSMMYLDYDMLEEVGANGFTFPVSNLDMSGMQLWGTGEMDINFNTMTLEVDSNNKVVFDGDKIASTPNKTYVNADVRIGTITDSTNYFYEYITDSSFKPSDIPTGDVADATIYGVKLVVGDESGKSSLFAGLGENITDVNPSIPTGEDLKAIIGDSKRFIYMKSTFNKFGMSCPVQPGDTCYLLFDKKTATCKSITAFSTVSSTLDETVINDYYLIEFDRDIADNNYTAVTCGTGDDTYDLYAPIINLKRRPKFTMYASRPFMRLTGYTYESGKPTGTDMWSKLEWQKDIMSTLTKYEGLYTALTSSNDLEYRYIIDTFESYIDTGLKKLLSQLAQDKGNALFIGNLPSMTSFVDCPYTSFKNSHGVFKTDYIVSGGEGAMRFSLPIEADGASFAAFYSPLKFTDMGLKIDIPSAALVSNNFMDKYTSRQPYYVVAGPNYGRMMYDNMIGPDFNYSQTDRDNLEPLGMNVMIYKPKKGTFINSNQTAKQSPVTALSKVNIRELVIYLQDEVAKILENYHWEMNTTTLRAIIKSKADALCTRVQSNGGLYAFYNQCDDLNNTAEVIDNEMLVLSTSIEPAKGAGKMVHELTIYNTGEMSSNIK